MKDKCNHEVNNNIQDRYMAFKNLEDRQKDYEVVDLISVDVSCRILKILLSQYVSAY
jgi:hypothetical protein